MGIDGWGVGEMYKGKLLGGTLWICGLVFSCAVTVVFLSKNSLYFLSLSEKGSVAAL